MTRNGKRAFHARFLLPLSLLSVSGSLTFRLCFHSHTKKDLNPCCLTVQSLPCVSCLWPLSVVGLKRIWEEKF